MDRFLVSIEFGANWEGLGAKALERRWSDHYPIMLSDIVVNFGPKPIKIFVVWLEGSNIENIIREVWEVEVRPRRPDQIVKEKLKNIRNVLKEKITEASKTWFWKWND